MTPPTRIVRDPDTLGGKPFVRGTRISVEFILGPFAEGWSEAEILEDYAHLQSEDIRACLAYARDALETTNFVSSAA